MIMSALLLDKLKAVQSYIYKDDDYLRSLDGSIQKSKFDEALCNGWDAAMDAGFFRHGLEEVRVAIAPGAKDFVKQLNVKRTTTRRPPQHILRVDQPFNVELFNFTRVPEHEVLMKLCPNDGTCTSKSGDSMNLVIINVSPLGYGHVLIVPEVFYNHPQVLTQPAVLLGVHTLLLSNRRSFRVGFNSLCAYASVNHLHLHGYYVEEHLYIEQLKGRELANGLYELQGSSCPGFGLQLGALELELFSRRVSAVTQYLHRNNIAHSVSMTRAVSLDCSDSTSEINYVRALIWPRRSILDQNHGQPVNIACAEISGLFVLRDEISFESLTEDDLDGYIAAESLPSEQWSQIKTDCIDLFQRL